MDEYRVPRRRGYRGAPSNGRQKSIRSPEARDRRVPCEGEDDRGLPRQGLHGRVVDRPRPRPAAQRGRGAAGSEAGALGAARRRRRSRLRAPLRRRPEEEGGRQRSARQAEIGRRAPARDRRRPRRRGDRLAPRRGAATQGAGAAHGLPRDHEAGDRARAHRDARDRRPARRRTGDAAHPRPALRLRGLARALAEGDEGPLGRAGPVGCDAARRRARARADRVPGRRVLGHRRDVRPGRLRGAPGRGRRPPGRAGTRLRPLRRARDGGRRPARRERRPLPRRGARRPRLRGPVGRAQAVHPPPGRAVHDLDAAAGGEPQAPLLGAAHDARRPAPVRERLHHLHAHRLDVALRVGDRRRARPGAHTLRRRFRARPSRATTTARSRTRRRPTRRSARRATASACPTRSRARSSATRLRSTT